MFADAKKNKRAALIGYIPAGFPDQKSSLKIIESMVEGGVDAVEIGFPYSDPVMDVQLFRLLLSKQLKMVRASRKFLIY